MMNNDTHYDQWLAGLKVGSEVVIEQPYTRMPYYLSMVTEIAPDGRIRAKGFSSLLFKDGDASTDNKYWYTLLEPVDEILDKINLINCRKSIMSTNWNKVDGDTIMDVWDLLNT